MCSLDRTGPDPAAKVWPDIRADSPAGRRETVEDSMPAIQATHMEKDRYRVAIGRHSLIVDQPQTAGGDDEGPTPVELFVASVVACVAHYAGSFLTRHGLSTEDLRVEGTHVMATDRPARVASISVTINPPAGLSPTRQAGLLAVASHCTVHNTLRQLPTVTVSYPDMSPAIDGPPDPVRTS
jgi:putative redox protein